MSEHDEDQQARMDAKWSEEAQKADSRRQEARGDLQRDEEGDGRESGADTLSLQRWLAEQLKEEIYYSTDERFYWRAGNCVRPTEWLAIVAMVEARIDRGTPRLQYWCALLSLRDGDEIAAAISPWPQRAAALRANLGRKEGE